MSGVHGYECLRRPYRSGDGDRMLPHIPRSLIIVAATHWAQLTMGVAFPHALVHLMQVCLTRGDGMAGVFLQTIFDEVRQALDSGNYERAVGMAQHILQHVPTAIEGHRLLGEAYLNAGQFEPACEAFEEVLRADPEHIAAYYGLGLARRSLNQTSEAIHALEQALEIQPNLAELRTQLLQLYAETPNSAGQFRLSRSGLGRLYARGQMYTQAIDEFRAVLDNEPNRDDVSVALAEVLWRDGQEDAAVEWCRITTEAKPELFKPTLILGYLLLAAGQPEGEPLWRRAIAQESSFATAESLFEVLPPIQIDEPVVPAFDEQAWRAANAPAVVATDEPDATQSAPSDGQSDDDLLASLLGFDFGDDTDVTPEPEAAAPSSADVTEEEAAAPAATTADPAEAVDSSDQGERADTNTEPPIDMPDQAPDADLIPAANLSDLTVTEPTPSDDGLPGTDAEPYPMFRRPQWSATTSFGRVEPFRLEDWDASPEQVEQSEAESPNTAQAAPAPVSETSSVTTTDAAPEPPAAMTTGTAPESPPHDVPTPESAAQSAQSTASDSNERAPFGDIKPFSLADLDDEFDDDRSSFVDIAGDDIHPFSLRELGLDSQGAGDTEASTQPTTFQGESDTSFSLRELGLGQNRDSTRIPDHSTRDTADAYGSSLDREDAPPYEGSSLGFGDDERTEWEKNAQPEQGPWNDPGLYDADTTVQEPVTPFSLADLGLTEEELERWSVDTAIPPTAPLAPPHEETTRFSLADFEPSAPSTVTNAAPHQDDEQASIHTAETQPFDVSALLAEDDTADEPAAQPTAEPDEPQAPEAPPLPEHPTLQRLHDQLALDTENHTLRLALARANAQLANTEQAFEQYKQLVKRGVMIEPTLEDLNDLLDTTDDRGTLRRIHRLVGDVYMQQGRVDEAVTEYSWT